MLLAAILCAFSSNLHADNNPGITAAPILEIPVSARAVGMGNAFSGVADDVTALQYNPAGLSLLQSMEGNFQYIKGLADQNIEYLAFGSPLTTFQGILGSGYSTLAGSILWSQNGSIQVNTTNPDGSLAQSSTINAGGDFVGTLGYSEKIFETGYGSGQDSYHVEQFLGATGKFIHSTLAGGYSATAYATDWGYILRSPEQGWTAGASLLNLGTKMTFISEGDPLPLTMRAGGSYQVRKLPIANQSLTLASDLDYGVYSHQWRINTGLEYFFMDMARGRLGYQFNQDLAGLTVGFGLVWENYTLDYAWAMSSSINDAHRIAVTYRFGPVNPQQRAEERTRKVENFPEPRPVKELEQQKPVHLDPPPRPRSSPLSPSGLEPVWIY